MTRPRISRVAAFLLPWLARLLVMATTGLVSAQTIGTSYPLDMCAGDRVNDNLNCTAADVQITSISVAPGSPSSCEGGSSVVMDLDVTVQFNSAERYDIGIFLSQDGADPQARSPRTLAGGSGSSSCRVAVLPVPPFASLDAGPFTVGGQSVLDTCGDGSKSKVGGGTGAATFRIPGVTILCKAINASGALNIPFVVSWDHQASSSGAICTGPEHPVPGGKAKCNAPSGVQGDVQVVTMPRITKTNPTSSLTPGDSTTYTITITNTTGVTLNGVVFKDPAVPNLNVTGVTCSAQGGASCPAPADTTVALMQGSGIVIPSMPAGSTATFSVAALLTGNPVGTLTNTATVSANGATNSASDVDQIVYPALQTTKTVSVLRDPVNGTANPKSIPGAEALYTISVANTGQGRVDGDSVQIADRIPANTTLFVGNLGGTPAGPVTWSETGSNLTFTYASLGSTGDDLEFSNDGGSSWAYTPSPDATGYDAAVTHVRMKPKGRMAGWPGSGPFPGFAFGFKVRLN